MGRLTEYFGRKQRRSSRSLYGLPKYAKRTIRRIETMKIDPAKVAEREARERMVAFPGPLQTPDDPPGCSPRMKAARAAVRVLMAMKAEGQVAPLTTRFDSACEVIDEDLGPIIRDIVFGPEPDYSEPIRTLGELNNSTTAVELSFETR